MTAIDNAERGRRNRRRGAEAERMVVAYMRSNGFPDARRYLAGDGRQPGDIDAHPLLCIEVRDRASSAWPSWCRQAVAEARDGMVPVVVRRTRGVPDVGAWECRVEYGMAREVFGVPKDWWRNRSVWTDGKCWALRPFGDFVERVIDHEEYLAEYEPERARVRRLVREVEA